MLKFGTQLRVTSAVLVPRQATPETLRSIAHRHEFDYEPRPGYLYVRSRAISSRCNDNYDEFPAAEIKKSYASFVGKPVFVNHHNEDHRRMRGVIIDAALHEDRNPDGSPDTWAEVLMEVDAIRFPRLAQEIIAGNIDRTSMGTDVHHSICSACGNRAENPAQYCQHIPRMKGQRLYRVSASTGQREGVLIREICYGLGFFENSLLVEPPADPTAYTFGLDTRGLSATAAREVIEEAEEITREAAAPVVLPFEPLLVRTASRTTPTDVYGDPLWSEAKGKKINEMSPEELANHRAGQAEGKAWVKDNPVHAQHVIDSYGRSTADERTNGDNWYADAHHLTKHIAKDTGTHMTTAAGLMSNYSPQTHWSENIMNAARVMRGKRGIGGGGSGIFASHDQREKGDRLLGGEHYNDVLGAPKTKHFAHLIEHGGNEDNSQPHVVVDRHALSVAAGRPANDYAYQASGLGSKSGIKYKHVAQTYVDAAKHLSAVHGRTIHPHQVQATTWLVQQRENEARDRELSKTASSSNASVAATAVKKWNSYAAEHHPGAVGKEPGTGYSAHPMPDQPDDVTHAQNMAKDHPRPKDEHGGGGFALATLRPMHPIYSTQD